MGLNPHCVQTSHSVLNWNFSSTSPHFLIITPDPLVIWGCVYTLWSGLKIIYNFHVDYFPWICPVSVSWDFRNHRQSGTDSAQKVKRNRRTYHFEIQPNLKRSRSILHFWPNCFRSSVMELILTLAPKPKFLSSFGWNLHFHAVFGSL
jgi:hypothetical protein